MFNRFTTAGLYFDKDGAGGAPAHDAEDKDEKEDVKDNKSSQESGDDQQEEKGKAEKKFTQADIDQIVKDRLKRQKDQDEKEAEKARAKTEEEALAKNSEFQKLAETRLTKITELESQIKDLNTVREQSDKYKGALETYLAEAKKSLPKHVLSLVDKLDVVDALDYITANAEELGVKALGVPETPKEKDKNKLTDEQKKEASNAASNLIHRNY